MLGIKSQERQNVFHKAYGQVILPRVTIHFGVCLIVLQLEIAYTTGYIREQNCKNHNQHMRDPRDLNSC